MAKKKQKSEYMVLVMVDNSEELHQALYYACRRCIILGGRIALLYCIPPAEFQHWAGVGELMRDEARAEAEKTLQFHANYVYELTGQSPVLHSREGEPNSELIKLIDEERDISMLIVGADTKSENMGPLISYLTTKGAAACRVPITIVPGNLSDEAIDLLTQEES